MSEMRQNGGIDMNFEQATDYIFSFSSLGARPSLDRIKELMKLSGNPQNSFKSVHVAGTNGKGSVATYISSALKESGYKTGLYTSPHVVSFCERIKIDGEMISEGDVSRITESLIPLVDMMEEKPTAFDLITAVCFIYFREQGCDFAVLECGLGGKFDSTNIVSPELSVLCSISLDHLGVLGNSLSEITSEKCGIIKCGTPVVSYPFKASADVFNPQSPESAQTIAETAKDRNSRLIAADPDMISSSHIGEHGTEITVDGLTLKTRLVGVHQKANMLTAYTALKELSDKFSISDESIISGFMKADISARLERVHDNPAVIVDGGHNADCAKALRLYIEKEFSNEKLTAVIAMMRDKQCDRVLEETAGLFENIIVTQVSSDRACGADELAKKAAAFNKAVTSESEARTAIKKALDIGNTVFVFGSFYLAGEAKEYFSH